MPLAYGSGSGSVKVWQIKGNALVLCCQLLRERSTSSCEPIARADSEAMRPTYDHSSANSFSCVSRGMGLRLLPSVGSSSIFCAW